MDTQYDKEIKYLQERIDGLTVITGLKGFEGDVGVTDFSRHFVSGLRDDLQRRLKELLRVACDTTLEYHRHFVRVYCASMFAKVMQGRMIRHDSVLSERLKTWTVDKPNCHITTTGDSCISLYRGPKGGRKIFLSSGDILRQIRNKCIQKNRNCNWVLEVSCEVDTDDWGNHYGDNPATNTKSIVTNLIVKELRVATSNSKITVLGAKI